MNSKRTRTSPEHAGRSRRDRHVVALREEIRFETGQSSLGPILVAASGKGVVAILIGEDSNQLVQDLQQRFPMAHLVREDGDGADLVARVVNFIEAPGHGLDLPLDMRGTAFQRRVWKALRKIPTGQTTTYTDLARKIGKPKAIRAVGNACSTNNIAIAIPCHRVLRKDGSLSGGYHWGADRQHALISREATAESRRCSPSADRS
jgi:AraC family transcriptional regulator of adaptative response/methylated-DNA-[protein]-cysteine methyltransferase